MIKLKKVERLVYPIHKDDAEQVGVEINLTIDDGSGLIFTPKQIKEAADRFSKSGHDNPIKHRDLAYGVGGFVEMASKWQTKHDDLFQEHASLQKELKKQKELADEASDNYIKEIQRTQEQERTIVDRTKDVEFLETQVKVKQTALDAKDETIAYKERLVNERTVWLENYEKRYGEFRAEQYKKEPIPELSGFQRFIASLFGILA